jgi:hypothetical protein
MERNQSYRKETINLIPPLNINPFPLIINTKNMECILTHLVLINNKNTVNILR